MAEPSSSSSGLLYLFVILLGPVVGPHAFVLFGATLGAATALTESPSRPGRFGDLQFILLRIGAALLFTLPLSYLIAGTVWLDLKALPINPLEILVPAIAYGIGWKWNQLANDLWPWVLKRIGIRREGGEK